MTLNAIHGGHGQLNYNIYIIFESRFGHPTSSPMGLCGLRCQLGKTPYSRQKGNDMNHILLYLALGVGLTAGGTPLRAEHACLAVAGGDWTLVKHTSTICGRPSTSWYEWVWVENTDPSNDGNEDDTAPWKDPDEEEGEGEGGGDDGKGETPPPPPPEPCKHKIHTYAPSGCIGDEWVEPHDGQTLFYDILTNQTNVQQSMTREVSGKITTTIEGGLNLTYFCAKAQIETEVAVKQVFPIIVPPNSEVTFFANALLKNKKIEMEVICSACREVLSVYYNNMTAARGIHPYYTQ